MEEQGMPEAARRLVDILRNPENNAGNGKTMRLDALRELRRLSKIGAFPRAKKCGGVNTHIHTNESFSIFGSPGEAAWAGYRGGLEVLGINDHYTIAGCEEFGKACKILGMKAVLSIEAVAMAEEAKVKGIRYNDPKNPGRIYLCGKGVVHPLKIGSESERLLETMRHALKKRCMDMVEKTNLVLQEKEPSLHLCFDDVLRLTPHGNVTERHVAQAITNLMYSRFHQESDLRHFLEKILGRLADEEIIKEGALQELIRNRLLKRGSPAFVEEPSVAFPSIDKIVKLFRDYGSIPTYPVLGNPTTEKENDLESLFSELERHGIFAVEVIPARNTRERLQEILDECERHGFPVFNGTEHNAKVPRPIIDELSMNSRFLPIFRKGAYLILGHQILSKYVKTGYITRTGQLSIGNRKIGRSLFTYAGKIFAK